MDTCTRSPVRRQLSCRAARIAPLLTAMFLATAVGRAQDRAAYLADRGPGMATSMFGSYLLPHELLVYPFYEYASQRLEYKPAELGFGLDQDFRGKFREHEAMFFLAYGISDRLALEFESVLYATSTLHRDPSDPSAFPSKLNESGLATPR